MLVSGCIKLFLVAVILDNGYTISTKTNNIAEVLWNLTSAAVQGRQTRPHVVDDLFRYPRPPKNFNNVQNIGGNSFMEALHSIASNDDLRCVAKLLCEVTAGTLTSSRQTSTLPFNVDFESFMELLSSLEGPRPSPLILYGKAAALGYTSKGNSASCTYAYPRCPSNPDVVIEYLNNHRGGFFRFFNGIQTPQTFNYDQNPKPFRRYPYAEERILNKPNSLLFEGYFKSGIRFPIENPPSDYSQGEFFDGDYRRQKSLSFPEDNSNNLIFEKPLPNHRAPAMIFPDRTGTGELLVDTEKFRDSDLHRAHVFYYGKKYT